MKMFISFRCVAVIALTFWSHASFIESSGVLLGESCDNNSTCLEGNIPHSYCNFWNSLRASYCQCADNYVASHDLKRCLPSNAKIGEGCEETVQCPGHSEAKSVCLPGSGICECKSGYIQNRDGSDCLVKINTLGTRTCQEDVQCQLGKPGRLSHCAAKLQGPIFTGERVCRCKSEAVDGLGPNANRCHKKSKNFGESCKFQAQCTSTLKNSICMKGKCEKHPAYDVWTSRVLGGRPRKE